MKKKQLISIIITGLVIIAVGVTGVAANIIQEKLLDKMTESSESSGKSFWQSFISNDVSDYISIPEDDFIGVLNIVDVIGPSSTGFSSSNAYNHDLYMEYIDQMIDAKNNKAIYLFVNSPGGNVYESDELYLKLMEYKEKTGRPIYAFFSSEACSGGYYISMAADRIYANRNCWTGSIGVIISLTNLKGLYEKLGIKEIDITSGKNKAMGSSGLDLTDEQYDILQSLVDEAYNQFVEIVSTGRGMDEATVRQLADGRIYSAQQALDKGLIDEVCLEKEAKDAIISELGVSSDIEFYAPENAVDDMFSQLFGAVESLVPQSDADLATDIVENKGSGVLQYYAK